MTTNRKVLMLPGDGIGPEVMNEVSRIIEWMNENQGVAFDIQQGLCGGAAYDAYGTSLTDETLADAMTSDAILFGAVGGPKWDDVPREDRPEAGLLRLRGGGSPGKGKGKGASPGGKGKGVQWPARPSKQQLICTGPSEQLLAQPFAIPFAREKITRSPTEACCRI